MSVLITKNHEYMVVEQIEIHAGLPHFDFQAIADERHDDRGQRFVVLVMLCLCVNGTIFGCGYGEPLPTTTSVAPGTGPCTENTARKLSRRGLVLKL